MNKLQMVWLPSDLKNDLDAYCKFTGLEKNQLIAGALYEYMNTHKLEPFNNVALRSAGNVDD